MKCRPLGMVHPFMADLPTVHLFTVDRPMMGPCIVHPCIVDRRMFIVDPCMVDRLTNKEIPLHPML